MKNSIKSKIIRLTAFLIILLFILQTLFNIFLSKPYYLHQKKNVIMKTYNIISEEFVDTDSFYEHLTEIAESSNLQIMIADDDHLIYDSKSHIDKLFGDFRGFNPHHNEDENILSKLKEFPSTPDISYNSMRDEKFEHMSMKSMVHTNKNNLYVLIDTPIPAITDSIKVMNTIGTIISIFVFLIGLISSWFISKKLSKPIEEIDFVAKNISNLNFDYRSNENIDTIEFKNLSHSINTMSDALKSSIAQLQDDIDKQKKIDKMRVEFIANVSHELKTPLCLLLMYSENLKNNALNVDRDYYCDVIIDETNRLNDMVMKLLHISKVENGLSSMKKNELDFSALCDSVVKKTSVLATDKKIEYEWNCENNILVNGDSEYLEQAIKNYITNAISHATNGGKIKINLSLIEGDAKLSVYNDGMNISDEDKDFLWESFYKTDKARVRDDNNHIGLGLYIVKTIINAHNGKYGMNNKENGVEFWFTLPSINYISG